MNAQDAICKTRFCLKISNATTNLQVYFFVLYIVI